MVKTRRHLKCVSQRYTLKQQFLIIILIQTGKLMLLQLNVSEGIIPLKYYYDGLHIAIATANDLEYIFSLNFKHINKVKTKSMTSVVNLREGYRPVTIASPMEVIDNDE